MTMGCTKEESMLLEGHCKRARYNENDQTLEQMSREEKVVHPPTLEGCKTHPDTVLGILLYLGLL